MVFGEKEYKLTSEAFRITYNTEEVVYKALGMLSETGYYALKQSLNEFKENGVAYNIEYTIDMETLEKSMENICNEVYIAPVNATATIDPDVKINYSNVINDSPFEFEEDVDGLEVDMEALVEIIREKVDNNEFGVKIDLPVKNIEADITLKELKANTVLRDYFKTSYSSGNSSNRVHNIKTAANYINKKVLKPGETFSMEATIGRRVDPEIWREAGAVIDGGAGTENQLGGGVCQVSTTLYNAVVKSDLTIVFRKNHSKPSVYVDRGLDATINTDTIDFKFKNNTEYDIYIFSWLDTGREEIYCAIYGQAFPDEFDRIEFESTLQKRIEPTETEYIKKSALKEGEWCVANKAITGYVYESYAYYYKGDKLVKTEHIDDSTYKMHPMRIHVWEGYKPGDALASSLEMVKNDDGTYSRKRVTPPEAPTPPESEDPTTDPNPPEDPEDPEDPGEPVEPPVDGNAIDQNERQ